MVSISLSISTLSLVLIEGEKKTLFVAEEHVHWTSGTKARKVHRDCRQCMLNIVSQLLQDIDGAENEHCLTVTDFKTRDLGAVCDRRSLFETIKKGARDPASIHRFGFAQWDQQDDKLVGEALSWLEGEVVRRGWTEYKGPEVWYDITLPRIEKIGQDPNCCIRLSGLMQNRFQQSPYKAARFAYPNFDFIGVAFAKAPTHSPRNDVEVRRFFELYEREMGWEGPHDWYAFSSRKLRKSPWDSIFNHRFRGSPLAVARFMYPEFNWEPWRFHAVPRHFWSSPREQRACLDSIIELKELDGPKDLLRTRDLFGLSFEALCEEVISKKDIRRDSGFKYTFDLISVNYPEVEMYPWMQSKCDKFWKYAGNVRWYLDWLMETLELDSKNAEDFQYLTNDMIRFRFGRSLVQDRRLRDAIMEAYPEHEPWDLTIFYRQEQGYFRMVKEPLLYRHLCNLFGESLVDSNYYHPEIVSHKGRRLQLDVWIPSINLAFEYSPNSTHSTSDVIERDKLKKMRCKELGITLISLNETWDGSLDIVRSEIMDKRPELNL